MTYKLTTRVILRPNPIRNNQRIAIKEDGELEISAVRASDVGLYTCMVRNL